MNAIFSVFIALIVIILGFIQFFAVLGFWGTYLGLNIIITALVSVFLVLYLPVIAAVIGFFGAVYAWGWTWWQAGLLLFGSLAFYTVLEILGLGFSYVTRLTRTGLSKLSRLFRA